MRLGGIGWLAATLVAVLGAGCAGDPPPPNLLLFVSDTLRADAVDCEAARARTPNLCALAERGVVFENAYAAAPWTLPSVVSLFTGSHAAAYARPDFAGGKGNWDEFFHVPDGQVLLAEALRERGYDALGFTEGGIQHSPNALQGLAEPSLPNPERLLPELAAHFPDAERTLRGHRFRRYLGALRHLLRWKGRPFFLLVWVRDPHAEYMPPVSQRGLLRAPPALPRAPDFYMRLGNPGPTKPRALRMSDYSGELTPTEVAFLVHLYHLEVRSVDRRLGMLLELLRHRGIAEDTLVVVTSDHGEGFGEHGHFQHGNTLFEELLRVPLVLAGPGVPEGLRVAVRVSQIDLMPTLRELLGVDCCQGAQGRSLARLWAGGGQPDAFVYAGSPQRRDVRDALIGERYKLIARPSGDVELYDLLQDPGERRDVAALHPERVARMRRALETIRSENAARSAEPRGGDPERLRRVREETRDQLRALGYLE